MAPTIGGSRRERKSSHRREKVGLVFLASIVLEVKTKVEVVPLIVLQLITGSHFE